LVYWSSSINSTIAVSLLTAAASPTARSGFGEIEIEVAAIGEEPGFRLEIERRATSRSPNLALKAWQNGDCAERAFDALLLRLRLRPA
jgi:hypothetical protein